MPFNILSIDVGMKNLAICLFAISDNMEYKIKLWDVLNLCEEQHFICGEKNKKCLPCNKNAKFFKHASETLNRYHIGSDGRTAYQRWKGKNFKRVVP